MRGFIAVLALALALSGCDGGESKSKPDKLPAPKPLSWYDNGASSCENMLAEGWPATGMPTAAYNSALELGATPVQAGKALQGCADVITGTYSSP